MASTKLGELLLKANLLQEGQLRSALTEQKRWGGRLGEILVRMSLVTEEVMVKALSTQLNIPAVNLEAVASIPPDARAALSLESARQFSAVPLQLRDEGRTLLVAMAEPQNVAHLDAVRALCRCKVHPYLAGRTAIQRAFNRFYAGEELAEAEGPFVVSQSIYDDAPARAAPPAATGASPAEASTPTRGQNDPAQIQNDPAQILTHLEEIQRKQVASLQALVEILIEKKIFSREEYAVKVKR